MKAFDVVLADSGIASLLINAALPASLKTLILQERGNSEVDLRVWEFRATDLHLLRERWPALCSAVLQAGLTDVTVQRCDAQGAVKSVQLSASTVKHSLPSRVWVSSQDLLSALKVTTDWAHTTWVHHGGPIIVAPARPAPAAWPTPAAPTKTSRMAQLRSRLISAADPAPAIPPPSVPCHPLLTSLLAGPSAAGAREVPAAPAGGSRAAAGTPAQLKITISQVQVANLLKRPSAGDPTSITPAAPKAEAPQPREAAAALEAAARSAGDGGAPASESPCSAEASADAGTGRAEAASGTAEASAATGGLPLQDGGSLDATRAHLAKCLGATLPPPSPGPDCYVFGNLLVADMVPASQVRQSVVSDAGPTFGGRVMWRGVTQLPTDTLCEAAFQTAFQTGLTIWEDHASGDRQLQVFAFPNGTCHWSMSVPWVESPDCLDGMPPVPGTPAPSHHLDHPYAPPCPHTLRMLRCLNAAATFGPAAQLLIRTTLPDRVQERPLLLREAPVPTSTCPPNVALLLDAAVPDLAAHSGVVALAAPLLSEVTILLASLDAAPPPAHDRNPLRRLSGNSSSPAGAAVAPPCALWRGPGCDAELEAVRTKRSRQASIFLQRCRGEEPTPLVVRPAANTLRSPVDSILRRLRTRPGRTPPTCMAACAQGATPMRLF